MLSYYHILTIISSRKYAFANRCNLKLNKYGYYKLMY